MNSISPREAWLEHRVAKLEAENKYMRSVLDEKALSYGFEMDSPPEQTVSVMQATIKLALLGKAWKDNGLHVRLTDFTGGPTAKPINYGYYLDDAALASFSLEAKAQRLIDIHQRLVLEIGKSLWGAY